MQICALISFVISCNMLQDLPICWYTSNGDSSSSSHDTGRGSWQKVTPFPSKSMAISIANLVLLLSAFSTQPFTFTAVIVLLQLFKKCSGFVPIANCPNQRYKSKRGNRATLWTAAAILFNALTIHSLSPEQMGSAYDALTRNAPECLDEVVLAGPTHQAIVRASVQLLKGKEP